MSGTSVELVKIKFKRGPEKRALTPEPATVVRAGSSGTRPCFPALTGTRRLNSGLGASKSP